MTLLVLFLMCVADFFFGPGAGIMVIHIYDVRILVDHNIIFIFNSYYQLP